MIKVINCVECKKSYRELCKRMFVVETSPNISHTIYLCMTCKYPEFELPQEQKTKSKVVTESRGQAPSATLISSTPARRVAGTKAPATTKLPAVGKAFQAKQSHARTSKKSMSALNKGVHIQHETHRLPVKHQNKSSAPGEGTSDAPLTSKVPPLLPCSQRSKDATETNISNTTVLNEANNISNASASSIDNNITNNTTNEDTRGPSESQMQLSTTKSDDEPFSTFQALGVSNTFIPVSDLDVIFK